MDDTGNVLCTDCNGDYGGTAYLDSCERCVEGNTGLEACVNKTVFVSSKSYTGLLGGLEGADEKCQVLADNAGLGGTYKAWLSGRQQEISPASTRFTHNSGPYLRVDGVMIAENWTDLIDGSLTNPINKSELNETINNFVWTNTDEQGENYRANVSCIGFTTEDRMIRFSSVGESDDSSLRWTNSVNQKCSERLHLYCFEQ